MKYFSILKGVGFNRISAIGKQYLYSGERPDWLTIKLDYWIQIKLNSNIDIITKEFNDEVIGDSKLKDIVILLTWKNIFCNFLQHLFALAKNISLLYAYKYLFNGNFILIDCRLYKESFWCLFYKSNDRLYLWDSWPSITLEENKDVFSNFILENDVVFRALGFQWIAFKESLSNKPVWPAEKWLTRYESVRKSYYTGYKAFVNPRMIRNIIVDSYSPKRFLRGTIKSQLLNSHDTANIDYKTLAYILRNIYLPDYKLFIDIGCGKGAVAAYLRSIGWVNKFVGIEINEVVYGKYLQTGWPKNFSFYNQDVNNMIFSEIGVYFCYNALPINLLKKIVKNIPAQSLIVTYNMDYFTEGVELMQKYQLGKKSCFYYLKI